MSRLSKFKALTHAERILLFESTLLLPIIAISVRVFALQKLQRGLARLASKTARTSVQTSLQPALSKSASGVELTSASAVELTRARQIARLVRAAANHGLYRANCLEQSLVLWTMLKRNGLESEIRFGARKEENELQAHAWVECLGMALNEDRGVEQRYSPFSAPAVASPGKSQ